MKSHCLLLTEESYTDAYVIGYINSLIRKDYLRKITLVRVMPMAPAAVIDYPLDHADVLAADAEIRMKAENAMNQIAAQIEWGQVEHDVVALQGNKADALARFVDGKSFDTILILDRERRGLNRLMSEDVVSKLRDMVRIPLTLIPRAELAATDR